MTKHVILFLAANPADTGRLQIDRECEAIERELNGVPYREDFQFAPRWAVGIDGRMATCVRRDGGAETEARDQAV